MPPAIYKGGLNCTREAFLDFLKQYQDAEDRIDEAAGAHKAAVDARKTLRQVIKSAGFNLASFDRVRRDSQRSGEIREEEDRDYRRMMEWLDKPVGTQGTFAFPVTDDDNAARATQASEVDETRVREVMEQGFDAGISGKARGSNQWTPGTYLYQCWDTAWCQGVEQAPPAETSKPEKAKRVSRGVRGRPRKKNSSEAAAD